MFNLMKFVAFLAVTVASNLQQLSQQNGYLSVEKGGRLSVNAAASMPVKVDAGWYSFAYGAPGTTAYRSFMIKNSQVVQLEVIGCYCPYNYFTIFDNGQPLFYTDVQLPVNSTFLPYPPNGEEVTCDPTETTPLDCSIDREHFGFGTSLLLPGTHNITIVVRSTPFLGGTAFLRADTICTSPENAFYPKPCCLLTDTCSQIINA